MTTDSQFRLPKDDEHMLIVGKNGTGKTYAGMWQLSLRSYNVRPWIIVDIKRDKLIRDAEPLEISMRGSLPREAGLYVVRPTISKADEQALDEFFCQVWEREGIGIYVDEGYALSQNNHGYRLLLMQGRAKYCPTITLSQRPKFLDRYVLSECSHYQIFRLNDDRDWQTVTAFTQGINGRDGHYGRNKFHSMWYNSNDDATYKLGASPDRDKILNTFDDRKPRRSERWV